MFFTRWMRLQRHADVLARGAEEIADCQRSFCGRVQWPERSQPSELLLHIFRRDMLTKGFQHTSGSHQRHCLYTSGNSMVSECTSVVQSHERCWAAYLETEKAATPAGQVENGGERSLESVQQRCHSVALRHIANTLDDIEDNGESIAVASPLWVVYGP